MCRSKGIWGSKKGVFGGSGGVPGGVREGFLGGPEGSGRGFWGVFGPFLTSPPKIRASCSTTFLGMWGNSREEKRGFWSKKGVFGGFGGFLGVFREEGPEDVFREKIERFRYRESQHVGLKNENDSVSSRGSSLQVV